MKNVLLASGFALMATTAFAGGVNKPVYEPTVMPPEIVHDDAVKNAGSDEWAFILMTFLTIVVAGIGGQ